jgi:hypothetical protein
VKLSSAIASIIALAILAPTASLAGEPIPGVDVNLGHVLPHVMGSQNCATHGGRIDVRGNDAYCVLPADKAATLTVDDKLHFNDRAIATSAAPATLPAGRMSPGGRPIIGNGANQK